MCLFCTRKCTKHLPKILKKPVFQLILSELGGRTFPDLGLLFFFGGGFFMQAFVLLWSCNHAGFPLVFKQLVHSAGLAPSSVRMDSDVKEITR